MKTTASYLSAFGLILYVSPVAVAIGCFGTYTLTGNTLNASAAYTALAFFTLLRLPLSFLPMFIGMSVNAAVALRRISNFLLMPDAQDVQDVQSGGVLQGAVEVEGGEFRWKEDPKEAERATLEVLCDNTSASAILWVAL